MSVVLDAAVPPHRAARCAVLLCWSPKDMLAFSMLWNKARILLGRAAVMYAFVFMLPAILVATIGIARLGLQGVPTSIGVGPQLALPLSLSAFATPSMPLLWSDDTTRPGRINTTAIMLGVASDLPQAALQHVTSQADTLARCRASSSTSSTCFAGVSFTDADGTSALVNMTILYSLDAIPYGLTVTAANGFTKAGYTTLQAALERAIAAAVNASLAAPITASTVAIQSFTSVTQAQLNLELFGYFYEFLATTGAVAFIVVYLPHAYWLAHTIATETEARLKEIMFVMGLRSSVYYASAVSVYVAVCIPSWLLMSALFSLLVFSSDYPSLLLLTVLTGIAPAGFVLGVVSLSRAEQAASIIISASWGTPITSQGLSYGAILASIAANIVLTAVAAWYASQVVPGQFGVPKPWNWLCIRRPVRNGSAASLTPFSPPTDLLYDASQPAHADAIVRIRDLTKHFNASSGRMTAVDHVSLDLFAGEVFVLLGRNGCGKTTTMNQLVGLSTPDGGNAWVDGASITRDMDTVRSVLGMCPQHDALWPDLTVKQTLSLYAAIKGVPKPEIEAEVARWLHQVGLEDKAGALAATLSGGMKRKLSVSIAFIGGSKVVLLDEPTAGVDPHSRRAIWDIIASNRAGRVILLTTHFLDEADVLADRIGVMSTGRLRGLGTPSFLKKSMGFGYNLTATFADAPEDDARALLACVSSHIPDARVVSLRGRDAVVALPLHANPALPVTLRALEAQATALKLSACGVSSASLQEVFLRLVGAQEVDQTHVSVSPLAIGAAAAAPAGTAQPSTTPGTKAPSSLGRFRALLWKRALLARNDWKTTSVPLLMTAAMAIIAAVVKTVGTACPPSFLVSPPPTSVSQASSLYPGQLFVTTPSQAALSAVLGPAQVLQLNSAAALTSALQSNASAIWGGFTLPAGASAGSAWPSIVAISNLNTQLSIATSLNAAANALYATAAGAAAPLLVATALQPFPTQVAAFNSRDWTPQLVIMGIILLTCALVVPLASTMSVARENAGTGALKQQQRLAGVTPLEYWGSHLVWDLFIVGIMSLIAAAGVSATTAWSLAFGWTLLLFFMYFVAAVLLGYIVTFIVSSQSAALAATAGYLFLVSIGIVSAVVTQLSDVQGDSVRAITYAGFAVNPLASLMMAFFYSTNLVYITCGSGSSSLTSYALVGRPLVFLALQIVVFSATVLLLERRAELELWLQAWRASKRASILNRTPQEWGTPSAGGPGYGTARLANAMHAGAIDADITAEAARVDAGASTDAVVAMHLRKEYDNGAKIAVHDLSLGLRPREAFGLLGTNGAGKTTTLQMMTGQTLPTSGDVVVNGHSLMHDIAGVQASVGVCPQHDVLWDELSAEQHLQLYAALKGVAPSTQSSEVQWLVSHLDLGAHAFKPSGALSGGNKRKLSVAIACVGAPPVIVLDEPSTGMDPAAKRFMWSVIAGMQRDHTVVLTTHSMEECEAVSERLGIMVAGRLVALGGPQHIKTAHGAGYQVDVICGDEAGAALLIADVTAAFPAARVLEHQLTHVRMTVPRVGEDAPTLAHVFDVMEELRGRAGIVTYQASQTSLEQVFLDLAGSAVDQAGQVDEAYGTGHFSQLPWDNFTLRAVLFNLILAPIVSLLCWGLLFWSFMLMLAFLWLPPVASALAACVLRLLKAVAQQELSMLTRYGSMDSRRETPHCHDDIYPTQDDGDARGCCCRSRGWRNRVVPLFCARRTRGALFFLLCTRFMLCLCALGASAALLSIGLGTVFLLPYTSMLQRRLVLWQRRLAYDALAA